MLVVLRRLVASGSGFCWFADVVFELLVCACLGGVLCCVGCWVWFGWGLCCLLLVFGLRYETFGFWSV